MYTVLQSQLWRSNIWQLGNISQPCQGKSVTWINDTKTDKQGIHDSWCLTGQTFMNLRRHCVLLWTLMKSLSLYGTHKRSTVTMSKTLKILRKSLSYRNVWIDFMQEMSLSYFNSIITCKKYFATWNGNNTQLGKWKYMLRNYCLIIYWAFRTYIHCEWLLVISNHVQLQFCHHTHQFRNCTVEKEKKSVFCVRSKILQCRHKAHVTHGTLQHGFDLWKQRSCLQLT